MFAFWQRPPSRLGLRAKPFVIDGLEHLLGRELLGHAPAQHAPVLEGLGTTLHHLGLERGDVVIANMAIEGIEQHHALAVEAVVLDEGPDRRRGAVEPHGRAEPDRIEGLEVDGARGNVR